MFVNLYTGIALKKYLPAYIQKHAAKFICPESMLFVLFIMVLFHFLPLVNPLIQLRNNILA